MTPEQQLAVIQRLKDAAMTAEEIRLSAQRFAKAMQTVVEALAQVTVAIQLAYEQKKQTTPPSASGDPDIRVEDITHSDE